MVGHGGVAAQHEGARRPSLTVDWQRWLACAAAVVGFVLCLLGWLAGGGALSAPWAPRRWSMVR